MKIKKDITFIYMDEIEKGMYKPIMEEAQKRGYTCRLTDNKFEKCEIGFYCQHVNFPQYSKFSCIMLHDIIQAHGRWPDIWFREPWNKYNLGFLPDHQWVKNWDEVSDIYYTVPKDGMFLVGWPKADFLSTINPEKYKNEFFKKYNLDINKKTILYAPAWENDNKEDDFVKAATMLDVNVLIKQHAFNSNLYPEVYNETVRMRELHKDNPRVTILDPKTNIFEVIAVSDVLVSEESSTLCEAAMMGIPSIAVTNWLIPDVKPHRMPNCEYDFVIKTPKEELYDCFKDTIENYDKIKKTCIEYKLNNFVNIGNSSKVIMDILDSFVEKKECKVTALSPRTDKKLPFGKKLHFEIESVKREICYNYCEKVHVLRVIWDFLFDLKLRLLGRK